jgi:hypothetical protein
MPVVARRHIRKMRGGAQSHLIEAGDGAYYVVKFRNNPQHRRILINELIAATVLDYLEIAAPAAELIDLPERFLEEYPDAVMTLGSRTIQPEPGWHFGSRYPGDPARTTVYDYVPDALLDRVANTRDFLAVFVFDKWVANGDARQCVFFRARLEGWTAPGSAVPAVGFVASMIDHGFAFQGPNWEFIDAPLQGLYPRRKVYEEARSLDDFQPWLDRVSNLPDHVLDTAWKRVPPQWVNGDEEELERLLSALWARRKRVPDLIRDAAGARPSPFPRWSAR